MRIPRKNSVWAFRNGPRYDIIEKIFFINKGKKKIFMVEWKSGFRSTLVRELFKYFEYRGFFLQMGKGTMNSELVSMIRLYETQTDR